MNLNKSALVGLSVAGAFALGLSSCEVSDPGLEEEVRKLQQENKEMKEKLKAAEAGSSAAGSVAQGQVSELQAKLSAAESALQELKNRFDRKRLEASFASAVSELKLKTQTEFPDHTISQLTLHEMVLPSDHPFQSGVTMVLRNGGTGQTRTIHLKGLGNINGEWSFKKVEQDSIASGVEQGAPPARQPNTPVAGNPGNPAGQPPATQPRNPVQPPPTGIRVHREQTGGGSSSPPAGGKVFKIDWGDR